MENIGDFGDLSSVINKYPLGFMDLLSVHNQEDIKIHTPKMKLSTTPNYSSISLKIGEEKKRLNENEEEDEDQEHQVKRNKRFKSMKSTNQTKIRVSFITKSEIDNLDDGYKWRKYGQKPVRNSHFPRNYYRCTISWCDVKKRVERSFTDPSNVITTYEGQHTHPSPQHMIILSKNSNFGGSNTIGSCASSHHQSHFFGLPTLPPQLHHLLHYNNQEQEHQELSFIRTEYLNKQEIQEQHDQELSFLGTEYHLKKQENGFDDDDHVMKKSRTRDFLDEAGLVKDHGLLEDVVSSHITKEESAN